MAGVSPPSPKGLTRYLAAVSKRYSPAEIALLDALAAEIRDDADNIGLDVTSDEFQKAWIVAGGMLASFIGIEDAVQTIERFWAAGFWPEITAEISERNSG